MRIHHGKFVSFTLLSMVFMNTGGVAFAQGIESVSAPSYLFGWEWYQPANVFDGSYGTGWRGDAPGSPDAYVRADFDSTYGIGKVVLRDFVQTFENPSQVELTFSNGQTMTFDYPQAYTQGRTPLELTFPPIQTDWLKVRVLNNYSGTFASLAEVEIFAETGGSYDQLTYQGPEVAALQQRRADALQKRSDTQAYIGQLRTNIDMDATPRFRTTSTINPDNTVTVSKEPWTLSWSLATGSITRATIKATNEINFYDAELSSLLVVDGAGQQYYQKNAVDGAFQVNDSKFDVTLTGTFTPRTNSGTPYATSFNYEATVNKMSSLVEVRYVAESAAPSLKELRVINTLGTNSADHDQVYTYGYYPGIMSVSNQQTGIQGHMIDWDEDNFSAGVSERLLVQKTVGGRQYLDAVLANVTSGPYPAINAGDEFNYAFSPLPVRKQAPFESGRFHPWFGMDFFATGNFTQADRDYIDAYSAKWGETSFIIGNQWPSRITNYPDSLQQFVDYVHQTGNKVTVYMDAAWNDPSRIVYDGFMNYDEMVQARDWNLSNNLGLSSPAWREVLLAWYKDLFTDYSIDSIYIDSVNETWDQSEQSHGNILGMEQFLTDLRLLVDAQTNDKTITLHMLGQNSTPQVALGDFMLPGEQLASSWATNIPGLDLQYNPYLYGANIIAYSAGSYDQANPRIVNQLLMYPLTPWLNDYLDGPQWALDINESAEAFAAYDTYRKPVFDFTSDGAATVHHPLDTDYEEWVNVSNDDGALNVILYTRPNELLIVAATDSATNVSDFDIRIDLSKLGLLSEDITSLLDEVTGDLVNYSINGDWLAIQGLDLVTWPRLMRLTLDVRIGDMDYDGDVDFDDIDDFVLGLTNPSGYEDIFGVPPSSQGDIDQDGDQDFDDIAGFVAILGAPSADQAEGIPEPTTLILAAVGLVVGWGWPRRGAGARATTTKAQREKVRVV